MSVFKDLQSRLRPPAASRLRAPGHEDTFQTLARLPRKRVKTGRTEQFNVRVKVGFKTRLEDLAANEDLTLGAFVETMLILYESGAHAAPALIPVGEARAGRTHVLQAFATEEVYHAIGKVAAAHQLSVSGLIEDLLAREIARLDPHGGKFGVDIDRTASTPSPPTQQPRRGSKHGR